MSHDCGLITSLRFQLFKNLKHHETLNHEPMFSGNLRNESIALVTSNDKIVLTY
jgi:hypothetical protein